MSANTQENLITGAGVNDGLRNNYFIRQMNDLRPPPNQNGIDDNFF